MSRATIVFAPDPSDGRLLAAARDVAERRLRDLDHEVTVLDLADFEPVLSADERAAYNSDRPLLDDETIAAADAVGNSQVLVFIYPTVLFTLPPVVKGWLDRVLVPGVAFTMTTSGHTRRGLRHIDRLVGVSTYDTNWWHTRRAGDSGRRILARNLRACMRLTTRVRWVPSYNGGHDARSADSFLARVERAVAR